VTRQRSVRSTAGASSDESGAVAVVVAVLLPLLLILAGTSVDIGRWYVEGARAQKAADAAATAGVTWMPQDPTSAVTTAVAVAGLNGYSSGVAVNTNLLRSSQLQVIVSGTVSNSFGQLFGFPSTTIVRSARADFQAPTLMGSPCNALGNQPLSTDSEPQAAPVDSVIPTTANGGWPACAGQEVSGFWLRAAGPSTHKNNGDRYSTVPCSAGDECTSSLNTKYDATGYAYVVRVRPGAEGHAISLQAYDPAYIDTGATCADLAGSGFFNGMNRYVPGTVSPTVPAFPNRAQDRYEDSLTLTNPSGGATQENQFCNGDNNPGGAGIGAHEGFVTSYVLRQLTDSFNPTAALPFDGCTKQFTYSNSFPTVTELTEPPPTNSSYEPTLAKIFHQWVEICTFTPPDAGDYFLQVLTNVKVPSSGMTAENTTPSCSTSVPCIYTVTGRDDTTSNPVAYPIASDVDKTGQGHNLYALRATAGSSGLNSLISVSGYERFPIYSNTSGAQTFNLVQVTPNAKGKTFEFSFYDVTDFSGTATLQVKGPVGSNIENTAQTGCTLSPLTGTLPTGTTVSGCTVSIVGQASGGQGRVMALTVPIPETYVCTTLPSLNPTNGQCWYRVVFTTPGDTNEDTTWDVGINGDPVRLLN
jgi:Flp pilus assembly protein TadG